MRMAKSLEAEDVKRWSAKRKAQVVLDILKGETSVAEVSRKHQLEETEVVEWLEEGQRGLENALHVRSRTMQEQYEARIKDLQAKVGELVLENDLLRKPGSSNGFSEKK